jgi:hypothetical protein
MIGCNSLIHWIKLGDNWISPLYPKVSISISGEILEYYLYILVNNEIYNLQHGSENGETLF